MTDAPAERTIVNFTFEMDSEQRDFIELLTAKSGISAGMLMRALIYALETDERTMNVVLDAIFDEPGESPSAEDEVVPGYGGDVLSATPPRRDIPEAPQWIEMKSD